MFILTHPDNSHNEQILGKEAVEVEMHERVMALEVMAARHGERIESVEEYQQKQNGSIQRIEGKVDGLNKWLIGLLGGMVASLILLIVNISIGR